jgi:predicted nucleic acid-binding protein
MRYLVDSNILIYAASGASPAIAFLDQAVAAEWIGYSAIARLEVFGYPSLQANDAAKLDRLLQCFTEVDINRAVINRAIAVRQSNPIKTPDAIVAATALLMNAQLVTRNTADFRRVSGLELVNPFDLAH